MATGDPTAQATISSSAQTLEDIGFTAAQVSTCKTLIISVNTDAIRFLTNGSAPTATDGIYLAVDNSYIIRDNPQDFQCIRVTNDAAVFCQLNPND